MQFNLSSSFSGAACETYQCNFTAVSCFDLQVMLTSEIFRFGRVITLLIFLLYGLMGRA